MMIDRDIVRFCAIECRLQMSGELSVHWMVDAWIYALASSEDGLPSLDDVINIGQLVEPNVNVPTDRSEFRTVDVRVGWDVKAPWEEVPRLMVALMESYDPDLVTPAEFFKAYEDIHPWRDGNGRSGVILFNWLNGTLDNPVWAPNFWNDPRRTVGFGA
jgi:hypothetical protein